MKPVLVLYATRDGHTRRIAEHLAAAVRAHAVSAEVVDAAHIPAAFSLVAYPTAILIASVHRGRHEPEMTEFVKLHVAELERVRAGFVSVSLSEAAAEDPKAPPVRRSKAAADVRSMIESFLAETGWRPTRTKAVAGALLYARYNFLLRFVMKRIARQAGGDTDTSRDHIYTDWTALDRLVDELTRNTPATAPA